MCLISIGVGVSEKYTLVLAANRDERHARAAAAADWWPDNPRILGGRDLVAGGSWLAVNKSGRIAAVTNRFDVKNPRMPRSRGELVANFLRGGTASDAFSVALEPSADQFGPFNLLMFDGSHLRYTSNCEPPYALGSGVFAFGNTQRTADWPKLRRAREGLTEWLATGETVEPIFSLLAERAPQTGSGEYRRNSLFVEGNEFGTRCSTVVLFRRDGSALFVERRFDASGAPKGETRVDFELEARKAPQA